MRDQALKSSATLRLMERTLFVIFGMSVLLALLFVAGNYQGFTDRTQLQVLRVLQFFASGVTIGSLVTILGRVIAALRMQTWAPLLRAAGQLVIGIMAASLAFGSSTLLVLFQPL